MFKRKRVTESVEADLFPVLKKKKGPSKYCKHEGCNIFPSFGKKGGKREYCSKHGKERGMISFNVHKKCKQEGCNKYPAFGKKGRRAEYCITHKKSGMINISNKKCVICKKISAMYGKPNGSKTHCVGCKEDHMVYRGRSCKFCDALIKNYKYGDLCACCYQKKYPFKKVGKNAKTKELLTMEYLKNMNLKVDITFDKQLRSSVGGCVRKRPDAFIDMGSYVIVCEVDEHRHKGYSCENKRSMEILNGCGQRPMVMIRLNPDEYICNGISHPSCFGTDKTGLIRVKKKRMGEWKMRLKTFGDHVKYWVENKPKKEFTLIQIFY